MTGEVVVTTLDSTDFDMIVELARCSLAKKAGRNNWVEEKGVDGLPEYICRLARGVLRGGSHTTSQAIAIAVSRAKAWASGGGDVNSDTRAKAAKAVAEWEKKKVAAKANNVKEVVKASFGFDDSDNEEFTMFLTLELEDSDLTSPISDRILELAGTSPCSDQKHHGSLAETVSLASVSSTYGSSNPGGRPKSIGSVSAKTKLHNAFPKPKKPRKMKTRSAFPTPSQNKANLKKALKLAFDLGYTDYNPDTVELSERDFSEEVREKYSKRGEAMPGGSYPIPDKDALRRAIQAFGRAKPEDRAKVKAHIKAAAKRLNCWDMLPEAWK